MIFFISVFEDRYWKSQGIGHSVTCQWRHRNGIRVIALPMLNLDARWVWEDIATPRPLYHREGNPAPIIQESERAPEPLWTGVENLVCVYVCVCVSCKYVLVFDILNSPQRV
jgi:hypothetical protein